MNTVCKQCGSATTLFLCEQCAHQLDHTLRELGWLLRQLDHTVQRQDKLNTGGIGKSGDNPSPINFGAMEIARETRTALLAIVTEIARTGTGRIPPLDSVATPDLAAWLAVNINHIARHPDAGQYYTALSDMVEEDERGRPGKLLAGINRTDRRFAGPCPTVRGHNGRGERIECATMLYAAFDEDWTRCPVCETEIDVKANRIRAASDRDIVTEKRLLEILANEAKFDAAPKVSRVKLYEWLRAGRLTPRGWLHDHQIVKFHIRRGDPRLFSLREAREIRARDNEARASSR